jgi:hypothetical protein
MPQTTTRVGLFVDARINPRVTPAG